MQEESRLIKNDIIFKILTAKCCFYLNLLFLNKACVNEHPVECLDPINFWLSPTSSATIAIDVDKSSLPCASNWSSCSLASSISVHSFRACATKTNL